MREKRLYAGDDRGGGFMGISDDGIDDAEVVARRCFGIDDTNADVNDVAARSCSSAENAP